MENKISKYISIDNSNNLDNLFLIIKKYKGKTFFYGNTTKKTTTDKLTNPRTALFFTKEKAEELVAELNSKRKRVFYNIESASKFFISHFNVVFRDYDNEAPFYIYKIDYVIDNEIDNEIKKHHCSYKEDIKNIKNSLNKELKKYLNFIDNYENILKESLKKAEEIYLREIETRKGNLSKKLEKNKTRVERYKELINFLENDLENFINSLKSETDKKFEILYGKTNN